MVLPAFATSRELIALGGLKLPANKGRVGDSELLRLGGATQLRPDFKPMGINENALVTYEI